MTKTPGNVFMCFEVNYHWVISGLGTTADAVLIKCVCHRKTQILLHFDHPLIHLLSCPLTEELFGLSNVRKWCKMTPNQRFTVHYHEEQTKKITPKKYF